MFKKDSVVHSSSPIAMERRAYPRYQLTPSLEGVMHSFTLMRDRHMNAIQGEVIDISEGGLQFVTSNDLPLVSEELISIHFYWNKQRIQLTGKLAWIRQEEKENRAGMAFGSETKKSEHLLQLLNHIR
ncbi:PilZ domain-containing protein [Pontibacillus salicampi]|uniref:PilZ domain-containing protein n=1 Tax=Pontibacillus salicampi TaxID=1449801 RepID=A0ABV6LLH2_9BACI